jgi:hypothetical protein
VVARIATLRVLLIVTFRPEFDPPCVGQPHGKPIYGDRREPARATGASLHRGRSDREGR